MDSSFDLAYRSIISVTLHLGLKSDLVVGNQLKLIKSSFGANPRDVKVDKLFVYVKFGMKLLKNFTFFLIYIFYII